MLEKLFSYKYVVPQQSYLPSLLQGTTVYNKKKHKQHVKNTQLKNVKTLLVLKITNLKVKCFQEKVTALFLPEREDCLVGSGAYRGSVLTGIASFKAATTNSFRKINFIL